MERRWLIGLGPPLAAVLASGVLSATPAGAADRAWDPPPCADGPARPALAAADTPSPALPVPDAWFTLDARLDDAGTLVGQRLRLGIGSQRSRYVDLPAESSVAGPFGRLVLVAADDERRSELRAIDGRLGCFWPLGGSTDVIRSATLDGAAGTVWEHRVDRTTRADLGIWRRPLDGTPGRRVLAPPPDDAHFGRTWTTSLGWSLEGDRLVVQHCGERQCRTRVVDPTTLRARWLDAPGAGRLLGVAGDVAVGYEACDRLPCAIVAAPIGTAERRVIVPAAGYAALAATPDGPRIVVETGTGTEVRRLDARLDRGIAPPGSALHVVPTTFGATAGPGLPAGWIAWSPDARSPDNAAITRLSDGRTLPVVEVQP